VVAIANHSLHASGGSLFGAELDDLSSAGIEIENASRVEYQIELQPERMDRIGRDNRIWRY
jgi:hypothetical protein